MVYVRLFAKAPGGATLMYIGGGKFARQGKAWRFSSATAALARGRWMQDQFPLLRSFTLSTG